ncbi:hypothetical protein CCB80_03245 [Armatimonadetes bacterium Uphvl-Ar1]|nr:hypothetical protein CCB80_03245 [Armatimonadetes bacterium Uphvl-Ar1]
MAWLEDADVLAAAEGWGVVVESGAEVGTAAMVRAMVNRELGYSIIKSAEVDRRFDPAPPSRIPHVQLGNPWSEVTEVRIGVSYDAPSGELLVADRDYHLVKRRFVDDAQTEVIVGVEFNRQLGRNGQSIQLTGKTGIWAEVDVPNELVSAGAQLGAAYLAATAASATDASDMTETTTGQVKIKFGRATSFKEWDGLTARGRRR